MSFISFNPIDFPKNYRKDIIPTNEGNLEITFIGHSSLMMKFNDEVIYIDPVSIFGADYSKMPKANLILLTHEHRDHLDVQAIAKIRTEHTTIILTPACAELLGFGQIMINGDHKTVFNIKIYAVPAYSLNTTYHPKGRGNGCILRFGEKKIYVAGDTENIPEMSNLEDIYIAFLPINQPYTMSVEQAVEATKRIRPKILYPYHSSKANIRELVNLLQTEKDIEVWINNLQ